MRFVEDMPRPRLVVLAATRATAEPLAAALSAVHLRASIATPCEPMPAAHEPVDVGVVRCAAGDLGPAKWALDLHEGLGQPEYVFVIDRHGDAAATSLAAIGAKLLLEHAHAAEWLEASAASLAHVARARRAQRWALENIPPRPEPVFLHGSCQSLFDAELRFREAYVRALVAQVPVRTEAAARAGIPYRTFSEILRKLGIERGR